MHRQKLLLSIALVLILLLITACGEGSHPGNTNDSDDQVSGSTPIGEIPNQEPIDDAKDNDKQADKEPVYQHELELSVYYTDIDVSHLQAIVTKIPYNTDSELYTGVWLALQEGDEEHADTWGQIELNSITLHDGLLTIDIQEPTNLFLGSSGEALGIQALIFTYSQVPEVKQILLTIDGEIRETLTGHVSINEPFELNEQIIKVDQ